MKCLFRPFKGLRIQPITLAVFIAIFLTLQAHKAHAICDDPDGGGAVFYNFEEIVIYYAHFPSIGQQRVPGYPEDLKYDNFTKLLTDSIRDRFSKCLTTSSGDAKPITVINPRDISSYTYQQRVERNRKVYDPKTLTIVLSMSYMVPPSDFPPGHYFGSVRFNMYRPGLSDRQIFMLLQRNSGMTAFFPDQGDEALRTQLLAFFSRIRPINYPMPNPEQGRLLHKKNERR